MKTKESMKRTLSRREMLRLVAAVPTSLALAPSLLAAELGKQTRLGVDMNSYGIRWSSATNPEARFKDTLHFLEHCHGLGAAGIQARIDSWENDFSARVRARIESWEMYLEGQVGLPRDESGVARFESVVR